MYQDMLEYFDGACVNNEDFIVNSVGNEGVRR